MSSTSPHGTESTYVPYDGSWTEFPDAPAGILWLSAAIGAAVGIGLFAGLVLGSNSYGFALFVGTPFLMGLTSALVLNLHRRYRVKSTVLSILGSQLIVAVVLLVSAMEGLICLFMALPLALPLALAGAFCGIALCGRLRPRDAAVLLLLCVPLLLGSTMREPGWPLRELVTEIEIDAPPEEVWPHVLGFGELPPPAEWIFRLGIAHPLRARLDGEGVGAVRYCEFSTGPFVEPITAWEPPRRLAFDVSSQPEPMHEWSPYHKVHAPHLLHGLQSKRGEFRLLELPDGRTLLRGTTWYELRMGPQPYWGLWSDAIIHGIHNRVLRQIRAKTEGRL